MKKIRNHPLIKEWRKFVKKKNGCIQCQNPWHDGICNCRFGKKYAILCTEIMNLTYDLKGWK